MTDLHTAAKQALEALENSIDLVEEDYANAVNLYGKYPSRAKRLIGMETMRDDHRKAITALREALAEQPVIECDCETATSPDGSRLTKCGSDQMRRAVQEGHAFCKQPAPTKCWKCGDADPAFTDVCQVPACGMREQP